MRKVSKKQALKNREVARIKANLPIFCCLCGQRPVDAAHLLPKSEYPEHYTKEWNIVPLCRTCHDRYDSDRGFRREQKKLVEIVKKHDILAANRYFGLIEYPRK